MFGIHVRHLQCLVCSVKECSKGRMHADVYYYVKIFCVEICVTFTHIHLVM